MKESYVISYATIGHGAFIHKRELFITIQHLLVCFSCWKMSDEDDDGESQRQHRGKRVGDYCDS